MTREEQILAVMRPVTEREESCVLHVYDDGYGNATIGWGSRWYDNGVPVQFGDPAITQEAADALLDQTLSRTIDAVVRQLTKPALATVNQIAAMSDLAYNIGVPSFATSSVLREFNAGNILQAHVDFALWNKARNQAGQLVVVPDLVRRRAREMVLFETPDAPAVIATPRTPPPRSMPTPEILDQRYRQLATRLAQWQQLTETDLAIMRNLARSGEGS